MVSAFPDFPFYFVALAGGFLSILVLCFGVCMKSSDSEGRKHILPDNMRGRKVKEYAQALREGLLLRPEVLEKALQQSRIRGSSSDNTHLTSFGGSGDLLGGGIGSERYLRAKIPIEENNDVEEEDEEEEDFCLTDLHVTLRKPKLNDPKIVHERHPLAGASYRNSVYNPSPILTHTQQTVASKPIKSLLRLSPKNQSDCQYSTFEMESLEEYCTVI